MDPAGSKKESDRWLAVCCTWRGAIVHTADFGSRGSPARGCRVFQTGVDDAWGIETRFARYPALYAAAVLS